MCANLPPASSNQHMCCNLDDPAAEFINITLVKAAINGFGKYKAPGPDGLPPYVYQHQGNQALLRLTAIFKASFLLGHMPEGWRKAKIIFLPKPGKDDYTAIIQTDHAVHCDAEYHGKGGAEGLRSHVLQANPPPPRPTRLQGWAWNGYRPLPSR